MRRDTKSPLKDKPLRNPGQSAEEKLHDYVYEGILQPILIAFFLVFLAAFEWVRYLREAPPSPYIISFLAVVAVVYAGSRVLKVWPKVQNLRLGRDGEKAVGQYLERLRAKGYDVFHDLQGDGFNVDHVLIGPAGVFTVETKAFSKPAKRDARIQFDGKVILIDGKAPDRNPVVQARAQAAWLRALLRQSIGKELPVRSVVVFPGWFVEQSGTTRDLWVLEPKALPGFLDNEQPAIIESDVRLASFHLSRFIRTS